jgi:hypothetical protein
MLLVVLLYVKKLLALWAAMGFEDKIEIQQRERKRKRAKNLKFIFYT